jgi:hypothetical protein
VDLEDSPFYPGEKKVVGRHLKFPFGEMLGSPFVILLDFLIMVFIFRFTPSLYMRLQSIP